MAVHRMSAIAAAALAAAWLAAGTASAQSDFTWPQGKRAAVTLSFDDARPSQVDTGLPLFDKHGVKATFLVSMRNVTLRLDGWKKAVANGHDIGSHTTSHPCTVNYRLSSGNYLEDFDLTRMAADLDRSIADLKRVLGVTPASFAFPCGQKFVGRGRQARSYIPLVAGRFLVGRGYLDESANDPRACDLSHAMGMGGDDLSVEQTMTLVRDAVKKGRWLILVGHEVGPKRFQSTDVAALEALIQYAKDPANGLWLDTMQAVARHILKVRGW